MDIEEEAIAIEEAARKKSLRSISAIEVALAEWEGSKDKSPFFAWKIDKLRKAHSLLSQWTKESLSGTTDTASRLSRLKSYTKMYSELYPEGGV